MPSRSAVNTYSNFLPTSRHSLPSSQAADTSITISNGSVSIYDVRGTRGALTTSTTGSKPLDFAISRALEEPIIMKGCFPTFVNKRVGLCGTYELSRASIFEEAWQYASNIVDLGSFVEKGIYSSSPLQRLVRLLMIFSSGHYRARFNPRFDGELRRTPQLQCTQLERKLPKIYCGICFATRRLELRSEKHSA